VALDFVLAHPEMVTALVLVAPALGGYKFESVEMLDFFAAEEAALERGDIVAATELNLKMWVDGSNRREGEVKGQVRAVSSAVLCPGLAAPLARRCRWCANGSGLFIAANNRKPGER
jgi:pimeloyl-ACP methyl ester carboxylesterase